MATYTAFLSNMRVSYASADENGFWSCRPCVDCLLLDDTNTLIAPWEMDDPSSAQQTMASLVPMVAGDDRTSMRAAIIDQMGNQYPELDLGVDVITYLWL